MFGHGVLDPEPDFWLGAAGALPLGAGVAGVVLVLVELGVVVVEAALAMPAAAPPVAIAPATIVAPSIFDMCIGLDLRWIGWMRRENHDGPAG
jgi:hypothetical protein